MECCTLSATYRRRKDSEPAVGSFLKFFSQVFIHFEYLAFGILNCVPLKTIPQIFLHFRPYAVFSTSHCPFSPSQVVIQHDAEGKTYVA